MSTGRQRIDFKCFMLIFDCRLWLIFAAIVQQIFGLKQDIFYRCFLQKIVLEVYLWVLKMVWQH